MQKPAREQGRKLQVGQYALAHARASAKPIVKILKRILLILLIALLLVQIPFIYRRYQTGKLAGKIAELNAHRVSNEGPQFKEYKGVIHVHTHLGGHSTGSFDELIAAANANELD